MLEIQLTKATADIFQGVYPQFVVFMVTTYF